MTSQPDQDQSDPRISAFWQPDTITSFDNLCQSEDLNPVRLRRLIDNHIVTKRRPSRQELVDALKHRPRIQERAAILGSITKKLYVFIETFA